MIAAAPCPIEGWESVFAMLEDGMDLEKGMLLARTSRLEECERYLEKGEEGGDQSAFLALVHYRLGHPNEARKHLEDAKSALSTWGNSHLDTSAWDGGHFGWTWEDMLVVKLIAREAESLILDADFPKDPFAP